MATSISGLSILVIDNDQEWREYTCDTLKSFGISRVAGCSDSADALARIGREHVDVIFVDSSVAPLDGLSLVRKIRSANAVKSSTPPIVLMMGEVTEDSVNESYSAGANDCLFKPFSPIDLMGHLMSVLERPQPFIRTQTYFGPDRRRRVNPAYRGEERRENNAEVQDGELDLPDLKVASKG